MGNTKNKNLWIILLIFLVILALLILWSIKKSSLPAGDNLPVVVSLEDTSAGSVNAGVSVPTISYENALIKYKDARLQINKTCEASPNKMTLTNNSLLMIDNRSPMDRVVKVGSPLNLKAYGFKIVKLESATLPATWVIDCDQFKDVATILIQN
ncbi:MAG: hypothetical protein WC884_02660 [Candidatus Paceibacterota bacterium]